MDDSTIDLKLVQHIKPNQQTLVSSSSWHGNLQLTYARNPNGTQILHRQAQAPLKIQRPFYPEGTDICHSIILHTAGGIVGGDRLALDIQLQDNAHALITTAAAAKIYRSKGPEAKQSTQVNLAPGACMEWLPQETIVFDQAHYCQEMYINLAPGATWLGWEVTRFGRSARGEKFLQGNWRSRTEVWQNSVPLWIDRQWIPGSNTVFHSEHGLANCPVVGSFALVGQTVEPDFIEQVRSLWHGTAGEVGITRLQAGLLCRYRGQSSSEVRQWFTAVWQQIRVSFLGRSTSLPRVWGV